MGKRNWSLEILFVSSLIIFIVFLFNSPKTLIYLFLEKNVNAFFISDMNRFTQIYININFFFVYILYLPSFTMLCFTWFCDIGFTIGRSFFVYGLSGFLYFHLVSIWINKFIFSVQSVEDLFSLFDQKIKALDLSYMLIQYYGFFWDFFFISYFYFITLILIIEKPWLNAYFIYNHGNITTNKPNDFWCVYTCTWMLRFCTYTLILYFFGGQSLISDCFILLRAITSFEIILIIKRFFCILQRLKNV